MNVYTLEEFADKVRFKPETCRLDAKAGIIGVKVHGEWRFTDDDIKTFLRKEICQSEKEAVSGGLTFSAVEKEFDDLLAQQTKH